MQKACHYFTHLFIHPLFFFSNHTHLISCKNSVIVLSSCKLLKAKDLMCHQTRIQGKEKAAGPSTPLQSLWMPLFNVIRLCWTLFIVSGHI
jgi:hypothetical protein